MKMFLKRTKGSITVMVTLILVPTIFFSGFMVDLARIKLYSNQALMTADNYGQAILTDYDNLLKELYGLFAISQNKEGEQALEKFDQYMQNYMKASFAPNENTVSWQYLQAVLGKTKYDGFMPYQKAKVELSYSGVAGANLENTAVFSTQIGDFMRFRIAQTLFDGNKDNTDELLDTVFKVQDIGKMAKVISKKEEVSKKVAKLLENEVKAYHGELKDLATYPEYLEQMNDAYEQGRGIIEAVVSSTSYQLFYDYTIYEEEIEAALEHQRQLEEAEEEDEETEEDTEEKDELTEEELEYIKLYEDYMADEDARAEKFAVIFEGAVCLVRDSMEHEPVDFANFKSKSDKLKIYADIIYEKIGEIKALYDELMETLESTDVDEDLKEEIKNDMSAIEELFKDSGDFTAKHYVNIADHLVNQQAQNQGYKGDMQTIISTMEVITAEYLNPKGEQGTDWEDELDEEAWKDFTEIAVYKKLYDSLKKWFEREEDNGAVERGKAKQEQAEELQKQAEESLKNEASNARDIPPELMLRGSGTQGSDAYSVQNNIDDAAAYFNINKVLEAANELLLKLYTVQYDMGMFSSRVTNVKAHEGADIEKSLTGYEMSGDINYLYKAELEYLLGGNNSSQKNLDDARNMILGFRAVINYTATYTVKPVNNVIHAITDPLNAINPLLAVAVSAALRLAVAGVETASDWSILMEGESVVLWKSELKDMTAKDAIVGLLGISDAGGESKKFSMNYEQYIMVMLIFLTTSEQIAERTADLITLNVNTVKQGIKSEGTLTKLTFTMGEAITAIQATCKVHLDFAVMPQGFARKMTGEETGKELESFEKNSYQFTVTRGY